MKINKDIRRITVFWGASLIMLFSLSQFSEAEPRFSQQLTSYLQQKEILLGEQKATFKGFSVQRGKDLYFLERQHQKSGEIRSCTTCHQKDARSRGETHVGKSVDPLAPVAVASRFQDIPKVEKWFRRNCKWVLERECSDQEKGDFITYLFSLR